MAAPRSKRVGETIRMGFSFFAVPGARTDRSSAESGTLAVTAAWRGDGTEGYDAGGSVDHRRREIGE
jgi:hypothetical protein